MANKNGSPVPGMVCHVPKATPCREGKHSMSIDIWQSRADLAVLKTLAAPALAGAFMRRWSRYIDDYHDTKGQAKASHSPSALWTGFCARWRLRFRA